MAENKIWSSDTRKLLYTELVTKFGPHMYWKCKDYPSEEELHTYNKFCKTFASTIGAESIKDVIQQIDWAISRQGSINNFCNADAFISNKQEAAAAGFIDDGYVPLYIVYQY